ncbi:OB-fold nucleic acid binding domain-containing protein, partial [bacterium]|nr:OB-fold nucleic acid binding domain-containing protein [bacterium]
MALMEPDAPIRSIFRISPPQAKALERQKIQTLRDLLFYFPARYAALGETKLIKDLQAGDEVTIFGEVRTVEAKKTFRQKITMTEARIADHTGSIQAVWFNQPYVSGMIAEGDMVKLSGRIAARGGKLYIASPEFEKTKTLPIDTGDSLFSKEKLLSLSIPIYPETRGLTSRWFYYHIQKILKQGVHEAIPDPLPETILKKYNLPKLKTALVWIHSPRREEDARAARKRFAFEEIFFIQLSRQLERTAYDAQESFTPKNGEKRTKTMIGRMPFDLTNAQHRAIEAILADFKSGKPMSRLLEGDVGSGKTAVAAATIFAIT